MKTTPHKPLLLRISPALKRALEQAAKEQYRSVNSLVEHVLAERFLPKGKKGSAQ
jgi:hypothetical protein